jgi:hypothetical protein
MTVIANLTQTERTTMADVIARHPRVRGETDAQHLMSAEQAAAEVINAQRTEYDPEGEQEPLVYPGDEWPPPQEWLDAH